MAKGGLRGRPGSSSIMMIKPIPRRYPAICKLLDVDKVALIIAPPPPLTQAQPAGAGDADAGNERGLIGLLGNAVSTFNYPNYSAWLRGRPRPKASFTKGFSTSRCENPTPQKLRSWQAGGVRPECRRRSARACQSGGHQRRL